MTVSRKTFLAAAGSAFAVGDLAPAAADPVTMRVTFIPVVDILPLFVGVDQGYFSKRNLDVKPIVVANQGAIISSLTSGSAEVGTSVLVSMLPAVEAGIALAAISACTKFPLPPSTGVLARTGSGIKSAADLRGKKIGVAGIKALSQVETVRWLVEKHVDPASVTFVEVPFPNMADLLKSGQLDAVVAVDPFFHQIEAEKIGYYFDNYVATIPGGTIIDCYATMKDWALKNLPTVHAFRDGIAEAIGYVRSNDAGARESLSRWTKQPDAVIARTLIPTFSVPVSASNIHFWIDVAKRQGLISKDLNPADMLVP